jgi:hypothetical protein
MKTMDDETIEHELRETLRPDTALVDRMVSTALLGERPKRHRTSFVLVTAGLLASIVAAVLLVHRSQPLAPTPAVVLTNVGSTVIAKPETGTIWLSDGPGAEQSARLPLGTIIVFSPEGTP